MLFIAGSLAQFEHVLKGLEILADPDGPMFQEWREARDLKRSGLSVEEVARADAVEASLEVATHKIFESRKALREAHEAIKKHPDYVAPNLQKT